MLSEIPAAVQRSRLLTHFWIAAQVRSQLASYMKPRSVSFVDELPMSPTGKIMKHVIKAPYWEGRDRNV